MLMLLIQFKLDNAPRCQGTRAKVLLGGYRGLIVATAAKSCVSAGPNLPFSWGGSSVVFSALVCIKKEQKELNSANGVAQSGLLQSGRRQMGKANGRLPRLRESR